MALISGELWGLCLVWIHFTFVSLLRSLSHKCQWVPWASSAISCCSPLSPPTLGVQCGTWTHDLGIKSPMLYRVAFTLCPGRTEISVHTLSLIWRLPFPSNSFISAFMACVHTWLYSSCDRAQLWCHSYDRQNTSVQLSPYKASNSTWVPLSWSHLILKTSRRSCLQVSPICKFKD